MRISVRSKIVVSCALFLLLMLAATHVLAASPDLLKAKKEAEAKGYIFFTTHDEIVTMAKKEGKLRVISGLEPTNYKPWINAFKQKYPFITDIHIDEISGAGYQRFLLEVKSGQAKGWDTAHMNLDLVNEYIPYLMKHDILGMAKYGVLKIDPRIVHPGERNMLSVTSSIAVVVYNRKLISEDKVPAKWEDFLKPEFKGRKFVMDLRPFDLASLVPAWGLERTLDFAQKIAAQQPVWTRSQPSTNAAMIAGEYSLFVNPNISSAKRAMNKDSTGSLSYKIIEPVPARIIDPLLGTLNTTDHPHVALLWLEFLASPEGQEIIDKYEPLRASVYTPSSAVAQEARGKKLSVIDWDHFTTYQGYVEKVFAAYGFPKAEK